MMRFRSINLSLVLGPVVAQAESWYKIITPSEHDEFCLDLPGSNPFDGNALWLWECNENEGQNWVFDNGQIRYGANEDFCIDAGDMSDGTQLFLWQCNGQPQQTWGFDEDEEKIYIAGSGTCLDFWEDQQVNGQKFHVWDCNGSDNQKWSLWESDGPAPSPGPPGPPEPKPGPDPDPQAGSWYKTITPSEHDELCLDLPGSNPFNGNALWLWECNEKEGQTWVFDNGQIRYGANEDFCIDAGDMSDGIQLVLWGCNGQPQQNWGFDEYEEKIYIAGSGTCLDFWEDQQFNGQKFHVWDCNGSDNQKWSLWDSDGPAPAPAPAPAPSPAPAPDPAPEQPVASSTISV